MAQYNVANNSEAKLLIDSLALLGSCFEPHISALLLCKMQNLGNNLASEPLASTVRESGDNENVKVMLVAHGQSFEFFDGCWELEEKPVAPRHAQCAQDTPTPRWQECERVRDILAGRQHCCHACPRVTLADGAAVENTCRNKNMKEFVEECEPFFVCQIVEHVCNGRVLLKALSKDGSCLVNTF